MSVTCVFSYLRRGSNWLPATKFFKHLWALRERAPFLISPKISPNSHPNRDSKGERLPADLAKIKEAPAGLQVSNSAHHDQLCLARAISALWGTVSLPPPAAPYFAEQTKWKILSIAPQLNKYFSPRGESAKRVGVSLSTFRRWRRKGIGPSFFLLGGILRYRIVDLDEFVGRHVQRGGA